MLNRKPIQSKYLAKQHQGYITQKCQNYNKLIALPGTSANLISSCYYYGLLSIVYTITGEELTRILDIYKIKHTITVVKIGMTRDYIIPEEICEQEEITKNQIPDFYRNKRVIGLTSILTELANNYINQNPVWIYYSRNQLLVYSTCKNIRENNREEIRKWVIMILKPEELPVTRSITKGVILKKLQNNSVNKLAKDTMTTYAADVVEDTTLF